MSESHSNEPEELSVAREYLRRTCEFLSAQSAGEDADRMEDPHELAAGLRELLHRLDPSEEPHSEDERDESEPPLAA